MSISNPARKTIYHWLPILIVAITAVAVITALAALQYFQQSLLQMAGESLTLAAADLAQQLDRVLSERYGDVQMMANAFSGPHYNRDLGRLNAYLGGVQQAYQGYYVWLGVTDRTGRIIAATHAASIGQDSSRSRWFQTVRTQDAIYIGDVQPFEGIDGGGMDIIPFAAPIKDSEGRFEGAVITAVGTQQLEDMVTVPIRLFQARHGFLGKVEYQFLTPQGVAFIDSDLAHKGFVNLKELGLPSALASESGQAGFVEEEHLRGHIPVITGYARTQRLRGFENLGWTVLLRMAKRDLVSPIRTLLSRLSLVGVAIVLPMLALLLWMERRLRKEWCETQTEKRRAMAAERQYRLLLESTDQGIFGLNSEGRCTFINKAGARLLDYQPDDLLGKEMHALIHACYPDGSPYPPEKCRILKTAREGESYRLEQDEFRRRDGSRFIAEYSSIPLIEPVGVTGAVVTFTDITQRKWAERALQKAYEELEFRVRQRTAELAEANSRLQDEIAERREAQLALQQANATLEERVQARTEALLAYQEQLRSLASELRRTEERERQRIATELHDNLAQMLAFCKMKLATLKKELHPLPHALEQVNTYVDEALTFTRQLMSDLRPAILGDGDDLTAAVQWVVAKVERHGLAVTVHDDGAPKPLDHDVLTVTYQSLHELLFNVLKHAQTKEAWVSLRRSRRHLHIVVRDKGVGFTAGAKRTPTKEGGFGLFNIAEQIEHLGGRLKIVSVPRKGTCARLVLPLAGGAGSSAHLMGRQQERLAHQNRVSRHIDGPADHHGSKIRVLLVDDHRMMREGLRSLIHEQPGLEVIAEASDGQTAVELARKLQPDIVIMDVNMPKMNGVEATRQIKTALPHVKIIGLSVQSEEKMAALMREAGASAYLSKGGAAEVLSTTIRSVAAEALSVEVGKASS